MNEKLTPTEALRLLLDHVDYKSNNCSVTDMVGGVLPTQVIETCRETLDRFDPFGIQEDKDE